MDEHCEVRRELELPVSRERAWELLSDPAELSEWLADDVDLEPREGGEAVFRWDDGRVRRGVVDEVDEHSRLAFVWAADDPADERLATRVEFALDDCPGGTRLTVTESGFGSGLTASAAGLQAVSAWAWEWRLDRALACGRIVLAAR